MIVRLCFIIGVIAVCSIAAQDTDVPADTETSELLTETSLRDKPFALGVISVDFLPLATYRSIGITLEANINSRTWLELGYMPIGENYFDDRYDTITASGGIAALSFKQYMAPDKNSFYLDYRILYETYVIDDPGTGEKEYQGGVGFGLMCGLRSYGLPMQPSFNIIPDFGIGVTFMPGKHSYDTAGGETFRVPPFRLVACIKIGFGSVNDY